MQSGAFTSSGDNNKRTARELGLIRITIALIGCGRELIFLAAASTNLVSCLEVDIAVLARGL